MNFIGIVVDTKAGELRILEEKPAYMWRLTVLAGDGCREFESLNGTWFIQPPWSEMFGSSFATSSDSCQQLTPLQLRSFGQDSAGGPVVVSLLPATLERSSILLATACTTVTHTHWRVRFLWVLRGCDYVAARCGHLGKKSFCPLWQQQPSVEAVGSTYVSASTQTIWR